MASSPRIPAVPRYWSRARARRTCRAGRASRPCYSSESVTLFDSDVRLPDDLLPAREIGADLLRELRGRIADRLDAEGRVAAADVGLAEHCGDFLLQAAEDLARGLPRRQDAGPRVDDEALEPALDEGRHFGQRARAPRRRHAEAL